MSIVATIVAPLQSPHVHGWNVAHGCASTTRIARASKFGREEAMARVLRGGVYGVNPPLAPPLIFIEHANGLPCRRPNSTLNRLGLNPCRP
jgi:hypothetical protein